MKEEMMSDGIGENSLGVASCSQGVPLGVPAAAPQPMPPTAPLAPQPRMVPPIGIHNDLSSLNSLNIFQQACIAHMQDLEVRAFSATYLFVLVKISCKHRRSFTCVDFQSFSLLKFKFPNLLWDNPLT